MIKSELVQKIADSNTHLYHRDVERIECWLQRLERRHRARAVRHVRAEGSERQRADGIELALALDVLLT